MFAGGVDFDGVIDGSVVTKLRGALSAMKLAAYRSCASRMCSTGSFPLASASASSASVSTRSSHMGHFVGPGRRSQGIEACGSF